MNYIYIYILHRPRSMNEFLDGLFMIHQLRLPRRMITLGGSSFPGWLLPSKLNGVRFSSGDKRNRVDRGQMCSEMMDIVRWMCFKICVFQNHEHQSWTLPFQNE